MNSNYLDDLNPAQRRAVEYSAGPELVIAGAGSGKTRVLTYKIIHLLAQGFEPWRILALTFTNKAAREMRSRIEQKVGPSTAGKLWMGTFHSIFARILRNHAPLLGYKSNFTIYDTADSKALLKTIIKDMGLDEKEYKVATVMGEISAAKNALISPAVYKQSSDLIGRDRRRRRPMLYQIYATYCHRCFVANAMDFDDLLYWTNVLLRDHPDVLHHYQEFFRYVLVDEYQDTNFAQHLIVKMLTDQSGALCVVGDDAQSIYSFRGANIDHILDLKKHIPTLETFKLEQNYRSTRNITDVANSLISANIRQIPKRVFSENESGNKVEVVKAYSDYDEGYLVANRIGAIKASTGASYEDFAILYRTNAQSRLLEESLRKRNIPYRIYGGLSFYQRQEVKDAMAYFRLSLNPDDDEALRRVVNTPARGIGQTTLNNLSRTAMEARVSLWTVLNAPGDYDHGLKKTALTRLESFCSLVRGFVELNLRGINALDVAQTIITDSGLIRQYISEHTPESIARRENLEELLSAVREFVEERMEEGNTDIGLGDFLGVASLATDQDSKDADQQADERVTLMTAHAAKGLEFENVFVVGVEEELFPSTMASDSREGVEEERRLLYVAITRAKRFCMLSHVASRFRNGMSVWPSPSRFIKDIDPRLLLRASSDAASGTTLRNSGFTPHSYPPPPAPVTSHFTDPKYSAPMTSSPSPSASASPNDQLAAGMRVLHPKFGPGTLIEIDKSNPLDPKAAIDFDNSGRKVMLLRFAKLTII